METSARDVPVDVKVYEVGILRTCQDSDESLFLQEEFPSEEGATTVTCTSGLSLGFRDFPAGGFGRPVSSTIVNPLTFLARQEIPRLSGNPEQPIEAERFSCPEDPEHMLWRTPCLQILRPKDQKKPYPKST